MFKFSLLRRRNTGEKDTSKADKEPSLSGLGSLTFSPAPPAPKSEPAPRVTPQVAMDWGSDEEEPDSNPGPGAQSHLDMISKESLLDIFQWEQTIEQHVEALTMGMEDLQFQELLQEAADLAALLRRGDISG